MVKSHTFKIQRVPLYLAFYLLFLVFFFCPDLWASQDAMVLAERAVIYSDREMTSPIGYVSRGKKIVVGEIPRNKAQVYPIIVSGKIAYIRVIDVTTEKESMDSTRLVAERFQKSTEKTLQSKFVASYFAFTSQISVEKENAELEDKSVLMWHGVSLKGEVLVSSAFDVQILTNYMFVTEGDTTFRAVELGVGGALRLINKKRFLARLEAQALAIPFSNYSVGDDFRIRSYGYTVGGGLNLTYIWDEHWGLEANAGVYMTKLLGFDAPAPYEEIAPSFYGNRIGLGLNYTY